MSKVDVPTQKMFAIMQAAAHAWRDGKVSIDDDDFVTMVFMRAVNMVGLQRESPENALRWMIEKIGKRNGHKDLATFISEMDEVKALMMEEVH